MVVYNRKLWGLALNFFPFGGVQAGRVITLAPRTPTGEKFLGNIVETWKLELCFISILANKSLSPNLYTFVLFNACGRLYVICYLITGIVLALLRSQILEKVSSNKIYHQALNSWHQREITTSWFEATYLVPLEVRISSSIKFVIFVNPRSFYFLNNNKYQTSRGQLYEPSLSFTPFGTLHPNTQ